jgi:hypothetical protein
MTNFNECGWMQLVLSQQLYIDGINQFVSERSMHFVLLFVV